MSLDRTDYLKRLLDQYCGLPHTAARRPSRSDRLLADQLFNRSISLDIIDAAFLLAIARRTLRDPQAPPLPPIRSLAYFLPLIDEVQRLPPDPAYLDYLHKRTDLNVQITTEAGDR
jgi:hypothetical protein